jgi:hypothetical protein
MSQRIVVVQHPSLVVPQLGLFLHTVSLKRAKNFLVQRLFTI